MRWVSGSCWTSRDQLAEALARITFSAVEMAVLGVVDVHRIHADGGGLAQVVERAVARDPIQPGTNVDLALVGQDRVEGGGEHLLEDVFGVLPGAEHVPAEGEQARLVARERASRRRRAVRAGRARSGARRTAGAAGRRGLSGPAAAGAFSAETSTAVLSLLYSYIHRSDGGVAVYYEVSLPSHKAR